MQYQERASIGIFSKSSSESWFQHFGQDKKKVYQMQGSKHFALIMIS